MKRTLSAAVLAATIVAGTSPASAYVQPYAVSNAHGWSEEWCLSGAPFKAKSIPGIEYCLEHGWIYNSVPVPSPSQQQNQNQGQQQTANGGSASATGGAASSNATSTSSSTSAGGNGGNVSNVVGGNYGNVPVYAPAPMAGCGDSASLNAAIGAARSTGLLPYTTSSFQLGATIPIGHRSAYCSLPVPVAPQVIYQQAPAPLPIAIPAPQVVHDTQTRVIIERVYIQAPKPTCAHYPLHDIRAWEARVREVKHRHSTPADDVAFSKLASACVPVARIVDP